MKHELPKHETETNSEAISNVSTVHNRADLDEVAGLLLRCRNALSNCNIWSFMILISRDLGNMEHKLQNVNFRKYSLCKKKKWWFITSVLAR
jgi:hypothetical protein